MAEKYTKSVGDWNPGPGKGRDQGKANELMSTEARDAKDTMTGTNELKQWTGGSGKPPAPYGVQGKKF
jgi:hypothetical protein